MRTVTTAQSAVYAAPQHARASWAKVEVYSTALSAWVDLGTYLGFNWVRSVELSESIDNQTQTATIECSLLAGTLGEITSSPFVTSGLFVSGGVVLGVYKQVRVSLAVTAIDCRPDDTDWMLKFRGRIDDVDVSAYGVTIRCRDEMGVIADAFCEANRLYGDNAGAVQVEAVIQSILNDWGSSAALWSRNGTGAPAFNPADSPGWAIARYSQERMTVMDAIRRLSDQIGYDMRFRWQTIAADIKLVMQAPVRVSPVSAGTFDISYFSGLSASLSLSNIRNYIQMVYTTKPGKRQATYATNAGSVTAYGRRWMEVAEEVTSQIDTATEAQAFVDKVLLDHQSPTVAVSGAMPLYPNIEIGDYIQLTGDGQMISTNSLGVDSITHSVNDKGGVTTLALSGLPKSKRTWTAAQQVASYKRQGSARDLINGTNSGNLCANGELNQYTGS